MILTNVIQDSAHELCPVAFCVGAHYRVGKGLTGETSDKRGTKNLKNLRLELGKTVVQAAFEFS